MHVLFLVLKVRATDMVTKSACQKLFHLPEPAQVTSCQGWFSHDRLNPIFPSQLELQ